MSKVKVTVINGKYHLTKVYELDFNPQEGWMLKLAGRVLLHVKYITQDLDKNCTEVSCDASLEDLISLSRSNTGWATNNGSQIDFENDPAFKKAINNIKKTKKRFAEMKRIIAKKA